MRLLLYILGVVFWLWFRKSVFGRGLFSVVLVMLSCSVGMAQSITADTSVITGTGTTGGTGSTVTPTNGSGSRTDSNGTTVWTYTTGAPYAAVTFDSSDPDLGGGFQYTLTSADRATLIAAHPNQNGFVPYSGTATIPATDTTPSYSKSVTLQDWLPVVWDPWHASTNSSNGTNWINTCIAANSVGGNQGVPYVQLYDYGDYYFGEASVCHGSVQTAVTTDAGNLNPDGTYHPYFVNTASVYSSLCVQVDKSGRWAKAWISNGGATVTSYVSTIALASGGVRTFADDQAPWHYTVPQMYVDPLLAVSGRAYINPNDPFRLAPGTRVKSRMSVTVTNALWIGSPATTQASTEPTTTQASTRSVNMDTARDDFLGKVDPHDGTYQKGDPTTEPIFQRALTRASDGAEPSWAKNGVRVLGWDKITKIEDPDLGEQVAVNAAVAFLKSFGLDDSISMGDAGDKLNSVLWDRKPVTGMVGTLFNAVSLFKVKFKALVSLFHWIFGTTLCLSTAFAVYKLCGASLGIKRSEHITVPIELPTPFGD